jgi:hypothetical protein
MIPPSPAVVWCGWICFSISSILIKWTFKDPFEVTANVCTQLIVTCNTSESQFLVLQRQIDDVASPWVVDFGGLNYRTFYQPNISSSFNASEPLNITSVLRLWRAALEGGTRVLGDGIPLFYPYSNLSIELVLDGVLHIGLYSI